MAVLRLLPLAALLLPAAAQAAEPHYVPQAGSSYVTRTVLQRSGPDGKPIVSGYVTASDVISADGTLATVRGRMTALIVSTDPCGAACTNLRALPHASETGGFVTAPIPDSAPLPYHNRGTTTRRLLIAETTTTVTPTRPDTDAQFSPEDAGRVIGITRLCPEAEMRRFLPIGKAPTVSFTCRFSVTVGIDPALHPVTPRTVVETYSFLGDGAVDVPAGHFMASRFRVTEADPSGSSITSRVDYSFSQEIGLPVALHFEQHNKDGALLNAGDTELIEYHPPK